MSRCAYLGPAGTFSHQAARDLAGPADELVPALDAQEIVAGILGGELDAGVVPFESSQEGEVGSTLDIIAGLNGTPVIVAERVLPVAFTLFRAPGDATPLTVGRAIRSGWPSARGVPCARRRDDPDHEQRRRLRGPRATRTPGAAPSRGRRRERCTGSRPSRWASRMSPAR